jgi:hypothetical protein
MAKRNWPPMEERFWAKVHKTDTCWLWTGGKSPNGYGHFSDRPWQGGAHRWAYEHLVGPIPSGLCLDHLCRVRHCVRPEHLEPITQRENLLRGRTLQAANRAKTHCIHGHPFDDENTLIYREHRYCRTCHRERERHRRAR